MAPSIALFLAGFTVVGTIVVVAYRLARGGDPGAPVTAATLVTLARGGVLAVLGGLVLLSPLGERGEVLRWLPGPLYTAAALADVLDGYLARRHGQVTAVGSSFDGYMDALGLLVAPLVAVANGQLPPWYLMLGAAFYVFRGALLVRERLGLPVHRHRLRRNPWARGFAAAQMTLVAVALYPIPRPSLDAVATVLMLPTLLLFAREWRLVTAADDA